MINKSLLLSLILGTVAFSLFGQIQGTEQEEVNTYPYEAEVNLSGTPVFSANVIAGDKTTLTVVDTKGDTFFLDRSKIISIDKSGVDPQETAVTLNKTRNGDQRDPLTRRYRTYVRDTDELPKPAHAIMKSGKRHEGKIVSEGGYYLTFVTDKGDTLEIDFRDVKAIHIKRKDITYYKNGRGHYNKGLFLSYMSGNRFHEDSPILSRSLMIGHKFNRRVAVGGGLSLDLFFINFNDAIDREFIFLTPFVYGRYNMLVKNKRLFASLRVGHGLGGGVQLNESRTNYYKANFNAMPSLGVVFASRRFFRFVFEYGLAIQHVDGEYDSVANRGSVGRVIGSFNTWMIRPMLKLGLEFR